MTVLEFIRKNSLLVLIVIVALFVGLVMMDYSGKGNLLTRDYYFKVNGTAYDYTEAQELSSYGSQHLRTLFEAAHQKLGKNGGVSKEEADFIHLLGTVYGFTETDEEGKTVFHPGIWSAVGPTKRAEENMAINRAIIREEAVRMGLKPSKDQVDDYIRNLPLFKDDDGNFDQALYQHMVGFKDGVPNKTMEKTFRALIEDLMVWELIEKTLCEDAAYYSKAQEALTDLQFQKVSGRVAWLPESAVQKPAPPTEDQIKKYWEGHKAAYKTPERRIITTYTLTAADKDQNETDLGDIAQNILDKFSSGSERNLEKLIAAEQEGDEHSKFVCTPVTSAACTLQELQEADGFKGVTAEYGNGTSGIADIAFQKGKSPIGTAAFNEASKTNRSKEQVPCWVQLEGGQAVVLICVEAMDSPRELTYEEAKERATKDCTTERENNALQIAANKMHADMTAAMAEGGLEAAFKKAEEAGAKVDYSGPAAPAIGSAIMQFPQQYRILLLNWSYVANGIQQNMDLPEGLDKKALASTPTGKLMPMVVLPGKGALVGVVERRTVEDSEDMRGIKPLLHDMQNRRLRAAIMQDFLITALQRLKVELSKSLVKSATD